jgi:DHA3 family tetracycline resistance protein-like MFS transporter
MARFPLDPVTLFVAQRLGCSFGLSCWLTYANVRRATELGFDPLQLVLVGAVLQVAAFSFEIPSGVFADVYGRRRSLVLGFGMIGAGFGVEAFSHGLPGVLAAQLVWGVGWTLISGARAAWLADEIGEQQAVPLLLRAAQLGHGASLAGIVAAGLLAQAALVLPLLLGAVSLLGVSVMVALCMTEQGFQPRRHAESVASSFVRTLRDGVAEARRHRAASTVLLSELFLGASVEIFERLWQLHVLQTLATLPRVGPLSSIVWFALIEATGYALAIPALAVARRFVDPARPERLPRLLAILQALGTCAGFLFVFADSLPLLFATWCGVTVVRRTANPIGTAWANQQLDSRVRATVLSVINQSTSLGGALGAPLGGFVGRALGVSAALAAGAATTLPALALFARAARSAPTSREEA